MKAKIFLGPAQSGKSQVADIITYSVGEDKTFYRRMENIKRVYSDDNYFIFEGISDDTQLIVFDDCPKEFDYSCFFPLYNSLIDFDIVFKILVYERSKNRREIMIPQLIFMTRELDPVWLKHKWFKERFDVINFPLQLENIQPINP